MMTVASLFAGIGGIDLGLERTGLFQTAWFCERDPYCQRVLEKHWPGVPIYDDATNLPDDVERVDVITAGFPCQPVSYAGRRNAQHDERWLWPYVKQCIRVLRPRGVLLENVPGLLTAGFDDVLGGLAACGYDAEWDCIPAAAVGAPHLRDRVFIIATPMADADGSTRAAAGAAGQALHGPRQIKRPGRRGSLLKDSGWPSPMADPGGEGLEGADREKRVEQRTGCSKDGSAAMADARSVGQPRQGKPIHPSDPTANPEGKAGESVHDGVRSVWPAEPNVGRVANGIPHRVDRLRALGNAVVPQVAEHVGHQLARIMGVA